MSSKLRQAAEALRVEYARITGTQIEAITVHYSLDAAGKEMAKVHLDLKYIAYGDEWPVWTIGTFE